MSLSASLKNRTTGLITTPLRRTAELDAVLSQAGYDPESINRITTPLIGAARHMSATIIIRSRGLGSNDVPFVVSGDSDKTELFDLLLYEPVPSSGGGDGGGANPTDRPIIIREDGGATGGGAGSGSTGNQTEFVPATATSATSSLKTVTDYGRKLQWSKLYCLSIQELVLSAGALTQSLLFRPAADDKQPSIFVMELVDARYFLANQMLVDLTDATKVQRGVSFDQWNMMAENPLHLLSSTIENSSRIEPDNSVSLVTHAGYQIHPGNLYGVPQPNPWYVQDAMSADTIISKIIQDFTLAKLWGDKEAIVFVNKIKDAYDPKSPFDLINLDLRARSVGSALDEIASRIGCVWVWDRSSQLVLEECNPTAREDILNDWIHANEQYRSAGGLNSLSLDMPESVVSIHPIRLCSTYGISTDTVIQDWRTIPHIDGVDDFQPTKPLYYVNQSPRTNSTNNRTAYIGDHLPAFIGVVSSDPKDWQFNIPTIEGSVTSKLPIPWNLDDSNNGEGIWFTKSYSENLERRNRVLNRRYTRLRNLVSGNLSLSRIPAYSQNTQAKMTPSIGLNMETIHFGQEMNNQVQYYICGDKQDKLILPSLLKTERVSALGLMQCRNVAGTINIEYLKPRAGIVRTFICNFSVEQILRTEPLTGEAIMWLYSFREVQLTNLPYPKWQQQDEAGDMSGAATGYAMNLCELSPSNLSVTPTINFDGGALFYSDPATPSTNPQIHMTPAGGLVGGFAPCFEIVNEGGATTYWIYVPNGVNVICSTTSLVGTNGNWQSSGISGVGIASSVPLTSRIV